MQDLEVELQIQMQAAENQLINFTNTQKQARIAALQEYANNIKAGMKIDNSEQQAAIMKNIDIILENAKAQLDGQAAQLKLVPVPMPAAAPIPTPVVVPETTPVPKVETSPTPKTEVIPEAEKAPEKEVKTSSSTVQEEPVASPPVEVDIYSVTDWFVMPNTY